MTNEIDIEVPGHTVLSRLGQGGMATVYLAREERLGRLIAVKVIHERHAEDEHFRRRFAREARTVAGLTHPNIVPIYHFGFTRLGAPYLAMAYLDGGSLRDRLRANGPLPVDQALAIARQLASALASAHAHNVVHRDLKPDNVLFQGDAALLTDFGIAKVLGAHTELTVAGVNPGSVRYFSPEQASEQPIDQRSDIYALGVLLYEMLTGRVPSRGNSVVHLMLHIAHEPPEPLPEALQALQPLLDVLLAKDPAARLGSCTEVITVLSAMERNWARFGAVDRLAQGVSLTPRAREAIDVRSETLLYATVQDGYDAPVDATVDATAGAALAPRVPDTHANTGAGVIGALVAAVACIGLAAFFLLREPAPIVSADASLPALVPSMPRAVQASAQQADVDAPATQIAPDRRRGVAVISRAREASP